MTHDEALKKIRKCMALALRQAQALMRQHQVDEEGLALATVQEHQARTLFKPLLGWEVELVTCVADAFGCDVISITRRDTREVGELHMLVAPAARRYWCLIGVDAAPEVAAYAFEVLGTQCVKDRRAHMGAQSKNCKPATRTARGDAFAVGWVRAVRALVEHFANGERHDALLGAYMTQHYPALAKAKVKRREERRNVKNSAWDGHKAGQRAQLHRGVGGLAERLLLPGA
jgi:hypothetical protein